MRNQYANKLRLLQAIRNRHNNNLAAMAVCTALSEQFGFGTKRLNLFIKTFSEQTKDMVERFEDMVVDKMCLDLKRRLGIELKYINDGSARSVEQMTEAIVCWILHSEYGFAVTRIGRFRNAFNEVYDRPQEAKRADAYKLKMEHNIVFYDYYGKEEKW